MEHGEIRRRIAADDGGVVRRAVGEADGDRLGAVDDVLVRDDVALVVVDESRALRLGGTTTAERPGAGGVQYAAPSVPAVICEFVRSVSTVVNTAFAIGLP